jgi:hypothetical protein
MLMSFHDLSLRLEPSATLERYIVTTHSPAEGQARCFFVSPFGDERVNTWQDGVNPAEAVLIGTLLFKRLFAKQVRGALFAAQRFAQRQGLGLRLKLMLDPPLATLPWEFLRNPDLNEFLALDQRVPIVRSIDVPPDTPFALTGGKLQLLWTNGPHLPARRSNYASSYPATLEDLIPLERISVRGVDLRAAVAANEPLPRSISHILHILAGCGRDPGSGEFTLLVGGDSHPTCHLTLKALGRWLKLNPSVRLVLLEPDLRQGNGCRAAVEMAADLVRRRQVPAVITMQFPMSESGKHAFLRAFYGGLAKGEPLDLAMTEGRTAAAAIGMPTEWGAQVLYSSARDELRLAPDLAPAVIARELHSNPVSVKSADVEH